MTKAKVKTPVNKEFETACSLWQMEFAFHTFEAVRNRKLHQVVTISPYSRIRLLPASRRFTIARCASESFFPNPSGVRMGSRPFMPDLSLSFPCSALRGDVANRRLLPTQNSGEAKMETGRKTKKPRD